jgi:hypothetical protein
VYLRAGLGIRREGKRTSLDSNPRFSSRYSDHQTLVPYLLTYSMEQSPSSEANRFSASLGIPLILWNPKVHYRSHKCPPLFPILSQLNTVNIPTSLFLNIYLNIIPSSTPESTKCSLSLRLPYQNPIYTTPLTHTSYMPRPSYSSLFYHPNNVR